MIAAAALWRRNSLLARLVLTISVAVGFTFELASASLAVGAPVEFTYDVSARMYDSALHSAYAHTSETAPDVSEGVQGTAVTTAGPLSVLALESVAANTGLPSLAAADLNPAQLANLGRYTSKLPAAAEGTVITAGENGVVTFTTRVPGQVPGSYATYAKTVDEAGTTIGYIKTTIAPDGTVVSVKDKLVG
jgi:hypothetical protein